VADTSASTSNSSLYRFSWAIVAYTVVVVAWGAWVRISGSGDGCGEHWPLCHGEAIPSAAPAKTWIEVSHRYSTALYGLLVLLQLAQVFKRFRRAHPARFWAVATVAFTMTEALLGRQLVTLRLVNESTDLLRLVVMPLHLVNTSLLLFSTVMAAESIRFGERIRASISPRIRRYGALSIAALLLLLTTGAIAALGSHLAPSESLLAGLIKDWSDDSHLSVRLRVIHPLLALVLGFALLQVASAAHDEAPHIDAKRWLSIFGKVALGTLLVGVITLMSLAPTWLKISHLVLANALVIAASGCIFHTIRKPHN
jgi:cytochrome c oxidase assembly protein subunit 15